MNPHSGAWSADEFKLGPLMLHGLLDFGQKLWATAGPALLVAVIFFVATYWTLGRRWRRSGEKLTPGYRRDLREISTVVAVGTGFLVEGRRYLWEHYGPWLLGFGAVLVIGGLALFWMAQARLLKLRKPPTGTRWW